MRIIIITPTRNEEKYIRTTIECMIKQTKLPVKWVIVNDGSTDRTGDIIQEFSGKYPFIDYVSLPDRGFRKPGQGVVETFYEGFKRIGTMNYDIVAKCDADIEFPPDTLESICRAYKADKSLGITGGTQYEWSNREGKFKRSFVHKGYVHGTNKFYRKQCFEDIGGLILRAGWDGVDIIRANMKGWKTGEIESVKINHLKNMGSAKGEGLIKACEKYGDVSYYMGGYIWYFILRVIGRSIEAKNPKVGFYMLKGYINSYRKKRSREPEDFRNFLKNSQRQNITELLARVFNFKAN